jgi:hypothetical protein
MFIRYPITTIQALINLGLDGAVHKGTYTYHSRFIPEGVEEVYQIVFRDTHVIPKFVSYEEHCRRDRW